MAYRKMVAKLMEGEFPSCLTCTSMLTQHGFNMDTFQGRLQEASADPSLPSPATNQISNLLQGLSLQYPLDGNLDLIPLQDAPAADGEAAGTAGHNFEAALYSNWLVYKMQWVIWGLTYQIFDWLDHFITPNARMIARFFSYSVGGSSVPKIKSK